MLEIVTEISLKFERKLRNWKCLEIYVIGNVMYVNMYIVYW